MKATARLHPHLLARKGEALPAIKRQRLALAETDPSENEGLDTEDMAAMMVNDEDHQPSVFGRDSQARQTPRTFGTNTRNQAAKSATMHGSDGTAGIPAKPDKLSPAPTAHQKVTNQKRIALTLRLDKERHFRLKLLSAHRNLSGQELMIEALDALLEQHRTKISGCPCLHEQENAGPAPNRDDCPNRNDLCQAKN